MSEKNFNNVRIVNKHDTEANWLKATGFTPKQGELIVYDIDDNYGYERIKIGDGIQNVNDLPFATEHTHQEYMKLSGANKITDISNSGAYVIYSEAGQPISIIQGQVGVNLENNSGAFSINCTDVGTLKKSSSYGGFTFITNTTSNKKISVVSKNTNDGLEVYQKTSSGDSDLPIIGVATPTVDNGAANKAYVDGQISNLSALIGDTSVAEQIETATYTQAQVDELIAAIRNACMPKVTTVTLYTDEWTYGEGEYYYDVSLDCITANSMVSLQADAASLAILQDDGAALVPITYNTFVRIWTVGGSPREDLTVQITVQQVVEV